MMRSLLPVLALALLLPVAACKSLPQGSTPTVAGVTPRITNIDFGGVELTLDVAVDNPLPFGLPAPPYRLGFGINPNGLDRVQHIASVRGTSGKGIPAAGRGTIAVPVQIRYEALRAFVDVASGQWSEIPYVLDGALEIPLLGRTVEVPFEHRGVFPVLRPPTFSNVSASQPKFGLSGAKLAVSADVTNPNTFDLGLAGLGYELVAGGVSLGRLTADTGGAVGSASTKRLTLSGSLSLLNAIGGISKLGRLKIKPAGKVETPWGKVSMPR